MTVPRIGAYAITCPWCNAFRGERCIDEYGDQRSAHAQRIGAALIAAKGSQPSGGDAA